MKLKLYSPLTAELENGPEYDAYYDEPDIYQLGSADLVSYQDSILEGIQQELLPEETERGLMAYFHGTEAVNQKVSSLHVTVEEVHGRLYGVSVCELSAPLEQIEFEELKSYITGQLSDGWGEGFEQRPRKTMDGDLYVHFWQSKGFYIKTEQEIEQMRKRTKGLGGNAR